MVGLQKKKGSWGIFKPAAYHSTASLLQMCGVVISVNNHITLLSVDKQWHGGQNIEFKMDMYKEISPYEILDSILV